MKIVKVRAEQHYCYIPLRGWNGVESAIDTYANGRIKGAGATENEQVRVMARESGPMGAGLFLMVAADMASRSTLVRDMLADARKALENRDEWTRNYDYDGMGTAFFKTIVEIRMIDRQADVYGLSINVAYVGNKPEGELAEHLGIPRCLLSSGVTCQTEPLPGDRFAFDFEAIIRRLDSVLGTQKVSGAEAADAIMMANECRWARFVLYQEEGLHVSISPSRVKDRFCWQDPYGPGRKKIDTWKVEGATLYGLLDKSYEHRGKMEPPSFVISLSDSFMTNRGNRENRPVWQPDRKERILALTQKIADALQRHDGA